jgi:MFS family permease
MIPEALAQFEQPASTFAVFRRRNFSALWAGQLLSNLGLSLTTLAASLLVYRLTGSAGNVGLIMIATAAPGLLVGLLAGALVDRFNRKVVLIIANLLRAALVAAIPLIVSDNLAWFYLAIALISTCAQFFELAYQSLLPETSSEKELAAANSLIAISAFASTMVGFAAAGWLANAANIQWAFYISALAYLVSDFFFLLIKVKPLPVTEKVGIRSLARNIQIGVRFILKTPILRSLLLLFIPVMIVYGLSEALLLPFATRALGANEFQYGVQESLRSLGFLLGSLLLAKIFDRLYEGPWIAISLIGMGSLEAIYATLNSIPIAFALVTISGFINAPSLISRQLIVQRNTPREMRGRVNSGFFVTRDVLYMIGMACAGLADLISVRLLYLVCALVIVAAGVWTLFLPGFRQYAAEWRKALRLLRSAPLAPGLSVGRAATQEDFKALSAVVTEMTGLSLKERETLIYNARVIQAAEGTAILRAGQADDKVYFILSGKTLVGRPDQEGGYQSLATLLAGDFFGEIAALTGALRTADVVAVSESKLLQLPAQALRDLMENPTIAQLFIAKLYERMAIVCPSELPRYNWIDYQELKEFRSPSMAYDDPMSDEG